MSDGVPGGPSARAAAEIGRDLAEHHKALAVHAATARAGLARAEAYAAAQARPTASGRHAPYPRWGWRKAVRFAVERRMYTPDYLALYARYLAKRLRQPHVELQGMVFFGPRVELEVRRHHARLQLGPWSWIGEGTRLRVHEGNVRVGPKAVIGGSNVFNVYLDLEVGENTLMGDWIYVCDFDHVYEHLHVPIRKQGLAKTPVRIGEDVWVGEKASILRGADIGAGSVVGSQTLVKDRIPPFSIVVGTPGRVIGTRLPKGMLPEEALALQRAGRAIPGDPLGA